MDNDKIFKLAKDSSYDTYGPDNDYDHERAVHEVGYISGYQQAIKDLRDQFTRFTEDQVW